MYLYTSSRRLMLMGRGIGYRANFILMTITLAPGNRTKLPLNHFPNPNTLQITLIDQYKFDSVYRLNNYVVVGNW